LGQIATRRRDCDLVASTALAARLDPEAFREVLRAYHAACATVIERFDGHIAQYLGSGLLVYFGYPLAHEDAPQRAVRTGLGIVEAVRRLNQQSQLPGGFECAVPLQVHVGIHTGLVVIDEVGDGARQEWLALGEVPNLATGLQSLAAPETVVTSVATWRLVEGWFVCQPLGGQALAGLPQPVAVYRVLQESGAQSRIEVTGAHGLTPLIGREPELALLRERWAQVKDGLGQVVLLSGEAGIGKSRLAETLRAQVACEGSPRLSCAVPPPIRIVPFFPCSSTCNSVPASPLRMPRQRSSTS
jgi:class 3 adenylate cyclase